MRSVSILRCSVSELYYSSRVRLRYPFGSCGASASHPQRPTRSPCTFPSLSILFHLLLQLFLQPALAVLHLLLHLTRVLYLLLPLLHPTSRRRAERRKESGHQE